MTDIPEIVQNGIDALGWTPEETSYTEVEKSGVILQTAHRYVKYKDSYEFVIFPKAGPFSPKIRLDWEIAGEAYREDEAEGGAFVERLTSLAHYQLIQDLFEILDTVSRKTVSKDIFKPVIPESAYDEEEN